MISVKKMLYKICQWAASPDIKTTSGANVGYRARTTDTGVNVFFGIGANGAAHGVYSTSEGRWLVATNNNTLTLGGTEFKNTVVTAEDTFSISVGANSYRDTTRTYNKAGFYPLGVVGFSYTGDGSTACEATRCYLSATANGSCTLTLRTRNDSGSAASPTVVVHILWIKIL